MCRMFLKCSIKPFQIEYDVLKRFVCSCHRMYFRKYNILGHHNLGWGFAYIPENFNHLMIKRDVNPIYQGDWKELTEIKTRFLVVHARKAYPWLKSKDDIHPINIGQKYIITHNGVIKSITFPELKDPILKEISESTKMDTRKYLCTVMDEIKQGNEIKTALEHTLNQTEIGLGANAFIFNAKECNVINYHNMNFNGRHTTLFIKKSNQSILVATTPILEDVIEIPNKTLIQIELSTLNMTCSYLKIE